MNNSWINLKYTSHVRWSWLEEKRKEEQNEKLFQFSCHSSFDILISSDKGRCVSFKFSYTVTLSLKKNITNTHIHIQWKSCHYKHYLCMHSTKISLHPWQFQHIMMGFWWTNQSQTPTQTHSHKTHSRWKSWVTCCAVIC